MIYKSCPFIYKYLRYQLREQLKCRYNLANKLVKTDNSEIFKISVQKSDQINV